MGADFTFNLLPDCKLTPERKAALIAAINTINFDDPERDDFCAPSKEQALQAVEDYDTDRWNNSRETSDMSMPHADFFITGGLSWGDAPTEAYDAFRHLDDVYNLLLEWAIEDKKKEATP